MKDQTVRITIRIPSELHGQIASLAKEEDRSWNWKMLNLLRVGMERQVQGGEKEQAH